jgi:hypothetical protein
MRGSGSVSRLFVLRRDFPLYGDATEQVQHLRLPVATVAAQSPHSREFA